MVELNDINFKTEVIEKSKEIPVLVDFLADWCGPCMILKPIIEKVSKDLSDKLVLKKMNVEDNKETIQKYGIMSIPTVMLFKNGEVVDKFVGIKDEPSLKKWIKQRI